MNASGPVTIVETPERAAFRAELRRVQESLTKTAIRQLMTAAIGQLVAVAR